MSLLKRNFAKLCTFVAVAQLVGAWNTFTVPHSPGQDDTPAILAALPGFSANSTILFQEGFTYNIFTPIKFPTLSNVEIRIEGNLTYPTDIPTIQGTVHHLQQIPRGYLSSGVLSTLAIVGASVCGLPIALFLHS